MAITTIDQVVAGLAASRDINYFAPSATNAAGGWVNLSRAVVSSNGQMAIPAVASAGGTLHAAGEAGFPNVPDPVLPALRYVGRADIASTAAGSTHLYDRLWSCSGLNGTLTTAQAVTAPPALTRPDALGVGAEIWIECYAALGATASNVTVSYTNHAGVAGRTTVPAAMIASMPANRMFQIPLQSGDLGVQSIQSVTLSASTLTAGNFGVTIARRVLTLPHLLANVNTTLDFAALGLPLLANGAAGMLVNQSTTTSTGVILAKISMIEG